MEFKPTTFFPFFFFCLCSKFFGLRFGSVGLW